MNGARPGTNGRDHWSREYLESPEAPRIPARQEVGGPGRLELAGSTRFRARDAVTGTYGRPGVPDSTHGNVRLMPYCVQTLRNGNFLSGSVVATSREPPC